MKLLFSIVLTAILVSGCDDNSKRTQASDPVIKVAAEDIEVNDAIAAAQATLTNFIFKLRTPQQNQKHFLIKGRFVSGDGFEHIWVADLTFDGSVFHGVLANEPERTSGLTFKQKIDVALTNVTDWMYVQDGKHVGGYTSRVLRSRMSEKERQDEDSNIPYSYK